MQIAFIDVTKWQYTVDTPYHVPLGGSQSALCYLAEQLAALGHDVSILNSTTQVSVSRGVTCAPLAKVSADRWREFDVLVIQNWAKLAADLRTRVRHDARLILWTQHAEDQPAIRALADTSFRDAHDAIVFVSQWQQRQYQRTFGIDPQRTVVLRNAVSPSFAEGLASVDSRLGQPRPPVLAYTSTPFRGLDVLLDVFPKIREHCPQAKLRIYSSMQVYQMAAAEDAARYGALYDRAHTMAGVEYVGSLPQPQLAAALRDVSILAYPNHFPETSCIAVMEAMASGCHVVTSDLGALPETTAGFATLVPIEGDRQKYGRRFVEAVIAAVDRLRQPGGFDGEIRRQVAMLRAEYTWPVRAAEWHAWLSHE